MANENLVEIEFGAKLDEITSSIGELKSQIDDFSAHTRKKLDETGSAFGVLGEKLKSLTEGFITYETIKKSVTATVELGIEANKLAAVLGSTASEASILAIALDDVHSSTAQYQQVVTFLSRQLKGNEDRLNQLGVVTRGSGHELLNMQIIMQNAINTVNGYEQGTSRNSAATEILGRRFSNLQELLNLNAGAMDRAREKADALGLELSAQGEQDIQDYRDALNDVHDVIHSMMKSIGEGLLPELTELGNWVSSKGASIHTVFGTAITRVMFAINGLVVAFELLMEAILAFVTGGSRALMAFNNVAKHALRLDMSGAVQAWRDGLHGVEDAFREHKNNMVAIIQEGIIRQNKLLNPDKTPAGKPGVQGNKQYTAPDKTSGAAFAVEMARAESELAMQKEYTKEAQSILDDAYKHGLVTTREYYDTKLSIEQAGINASIAVKEKELAAAKSRAGKSSDKNDALKIQAEEIKIQGQINVLKAQSIDLVRSNAAAEIDAENERKKTMQDALATESKNSSDAKLNLEKSNIQQMLSLRQISAQTSFQMQKDAEDKSYAATIEFLHKKEEAELLTSKNIEQTKFDSQVAIEQADAQHQQKITDLEHSAELERQKYELQAMQAEQDAFANFLTDVESGTKTLGDAFKSMANSIVQSLNRITAQKIAESIFGSMGKSGGGGAAGSLGGFIGKLFSFDVGTNYVPYDMLAMVHKGEKITPASQNNLNSPSAMQPVTVNNSFTVSGSVDTRTQSQIAAMVGLATQRAMARNT